MNCLSVTEAAERIGCTARHLRSLIASKKVIATQHPVMSGYTPTSGYYYLVPLEEVERLINNPSKRGWPRGKKRS